MIDAGRSFTLIAVMAAVTLLIRFLPFLLFSKRTPRLLLYLGQVLPYAIMAMLAVYCLRSTDFMGPGHGVAETVSVLLVVVLHKWRHNTLLSILGGTLCYMLFVQVILV